jgi:uncharacterized protein
MKTHVKKYLLLLLLFAGAVPAQGYRVSDVPHPKATDAGNFVCNPDGILDNASVASINAVLQSLEADTKAEVAVVVLQSIDENEIDDFAVRLFQEWGIGKKGADNGLLILFVLDQRAVRFETGYGLEGVLPDAICKRIQMQTMIPAFKNGAYDKGLYQAVEQTASLIRRQPVPELQETEAFTWLEKMAFALTAFVLLSLISLFWMQMSVAGIRNDVRRTTPPERCLALRKKWKTVRSVMINWLLIAGLALVLIYWSLGYVFFLLIVPLAAIPAGFYTKRQLRKFRNQPIACPACGTMMQVLPERKDNKYLNPGQCLEEKIRSMDYDVFLCDRCHRTLIYGYDVSSRYTTCPACKVKAWQQTKSYALVEPTRTSTGVERSIYTCRFCNHTENKDTTLPRLQASAPGYSPGRSGSFGGRSSGGGSFGGGRSGGGGSTSRW